MRKSLLALAALSATSVATVAAPESYRFPSVWEPPTRNGNNRPVQNFAKAKARAKMASKSRRQQRKSRH